jgi:hypothetical protein
MRSCDEAAEKHEIHNSDLKTTRIVWEMLPELLLVAPSTPSTPSPSKTWWRGSSLSLDYGIVEVTCINLSLLLWWLESHELPIMIVTIFVLPLWWIFVYEMIYEMQRCFVSDVWVDVYITQFLYACSDQTSMLGLVRGMHALVGVIW